MIVLRCSSPPIKVRAGIFTADIPNTIQDASWSRQVQARAPAHAGPGHHGNSPAGVLIGPWARWPSFSGENPQPSPSSTQATLRHLKTLLHRKKLRTELGSAICLPIGQMCSAPKPSEAPLVSDFDGLLLSFCAHRSEAGSRSSE